MSDYLYYCVNCNSLVADSYNDEEIPCEKCGLMMNPLNIDEDEWNSMSKDEKISTLNKYRIPQPQARKRQPENENEFNRSKEILNLDASYNTSNTGGYSQKYDKQAFYGSNKRSTGRRTSPLSIGAFVAAIISLIILVLSGVAFAIVPLILSAIVIGVSIFELVRFKNTNKKFTIAALIISGLTLVLCLFMYIFTFSKLGLSFEKQIDNNYPTKESFISNCEETPYDALARNPKEYVNKLITMEVNVLQVMGDGTYRVTAYGDNSSIFGNEFVMKDTRRENNERILQGDALRIYGVYKGTTKVTRALTSTTDEVPSFNLYYMEILDKKDPLTEAIESVVPSQKTIEENSEEYLSDEILAIDIEDCLVCSNAEGTPIFVAIDYDENKIIGLILTFGNASNENKMPVTTAVIKAFQDGVELEPAYIIAKSNEENVQQYLQNAMKEVQPGGKINYAVMFKLQSETSPIDFEIRDTLNTKYDRVTLPLQ